MVINKQNKLKIILYFSSVALIILGSAYMLFTWNSSINATSEQALKIANVSEIALNGEMFKQLHAAPEDIGTTAYESIKKRLINLLSADKKIRFAYIYTKKADKLYFVVDSEAVNSKDYSPPGQEYTEADAQYFQPFINEQTLITKSITDRWGTWISVLVPMRDSETGEIKAVFGMDYPAGHWHDEALYRTFQAGIIVFVLLLLFFTLFLNINSSLKIKESEKNYRTFFETIDDMVVVGDRQGKIFYANDTFSRKLGYTPNELENMNLLDINAKGQRQEAEKIFGDMLAGKIDSCPLPLERKDGSLLPVETRVWFGRWGGNDCIFGISKDLSTEQESLQKFNKIFDNNPTLMALSSLPDRKFVDVNKIFLKKIGYTKDEVIGKTSQDLKLFAQPEKQKIIADELINKGFIHNIELQLKTKSGTILDGIFSGEIIESQEKKYFLTVMVDQTERKLTEKEIVKKNAELEKINKFMTDREFKMIELKKELAKFKKDNNLL